MVNKKNDKRSPYNAGPVTVEIGMAPAPRISRSRVETLPKKSALIFNEKAFTILVVVNERKKRLFPTDNISLKISLCFFNKCTIGYRTRSAFSIKYDIFYMIKMISISQHSNFLVIFATVKRI